MVPKYARMFNVQTEYLSNYVSLGYKNGNYKLLNPITYFWLKYLNRLDLTEELSEEYTDLFFQQAHSWDVNEIVEDKYMNGFKRYFEAIKINEQNIKQLPDMAHLLEFYHGNLHTKNQYDRLKKTVVSHKVGLESYTQSIGPVLVSLCELDGNIEREDYFKVAFCDRLGDFQEYLTK